MLISKYVDICALGSRFAWEQLCIDILPSLSFTIFEARICSRSGIQCLADVVKCGRLRWFEHLSGV